jgi:hypothetical protein
MKEAGTTNHENQKKVPHPAGSGRAAVKPFEPKVKAKIMAKWSKIKETDVDSCNGNWAMLSTKIQEHYSYPKAKCDKECEDFKRSNKLE